jgi:glycosyltransferase involved in cell wall biosynthesis
MKSRNGQKNRNKSTGKTSLRIAMIGHKRIPSREGGIEIVVEELSARMAAAGNILEVYNRKGHHVSGREYDAKLDMKNNYKGIKIINIPTFQSGMLNAFVYSIIATIRALFGRYDCIHYHAEGPCAMLWLPHLLGIRTVATIHGLDWKRAKWGGFAAKFLRFGEKIAVKYADEVIVLSMNIKKYFYDTYLRKVNYIPNGIYKPEIKDDNVIHMKWGIQKNEYILFLGRIVPEKGLSYLIDAFMNSGITKKLIVAGGSSHTDEYLADIKSKAAADNRIIFTGFVQGEELEELYSNAYIYVLPSDLEGMPMSLPEAMSYGNCCLVSDIPECTEVVEDKAVVFHKSNVADLQEKLDWLDNNPDIVMEYKKTASDFVCERYNWDSVIENTLKLYRNAYQISKVSEGAAYISSKNN